MRVIVVSNSCCTKFVYGNTGFLTVVLVTVESPYNAMFGVNRNGLWYNLVNCVLKGHFYKGIIGK